MYRKGSHEKIGCLRWLPALILGACFIASSAPAEAASYVLYLHGRAMNSFPGAAYIGSTATWSHIGMSYNGSARLNDATVRSAVKEEIADLCTSTDCVIVCFDAGCARMFLALEDLRAEGRYPSRLLWSSASGSLAGGSELSEKTTSKGYRLISKILKVIGIHTPSASAIDYDLGPGNMRGSWGFIQNSAQAPVYHVAGKRDICTTIRILFIKVKVCGNKSLPGRYGDGAVAVHSAAGYSSVGARTSHHDGNAKYVNRAYEQVPLYDVDHFGILGPTVFTASLRLAVNKNATCPNRPTSTATTDASIVYEDADGAIHEESQPLAVMVLCGEEAWNGDPTAFGSCLGTYGCCDDFSTGTTNGCTCGETLCFQQERAYRSFFTGDSCSGFEYSEGSYSRFESHDGLGTSGNLTATITMRSMRDVDGVCRPLVKRVTWSGGCAEYYKTSKSYDLMRRVYRVGIATHPADPNTVSTRFGLVVSFLNKGGYCP